MAAAYAALVSLLNNLDLIQNHPHHSFTFENKQIESLLQSVNFLINFMETSDYHGEAEALQKRIAMAAHAAEDVMDSHVSNQIRSGSTRGRKTGLSRFHLDLQKAIEDMEFVRRKVLKTQSGFKAAPSVPSTPMTSQKNTMVGFDDVLHQLLDLLTGEDGRRVIPIVGMGGLGKTTLARNTFQNKLIVEKFDVRLWVTISQNYDVEIILKELLSGSGRHTSGTVAELGEKLYKSLYGRRYLIILDDIWSSQVWHEIMCYFPEDKDNRSRIVVTTRQSDVADRLTSSSCFPLDLLDKDKSWGLFCEKVFGDQKNCPPELEVVGHKILKKCRGLPLAIVVVAGHLRNSPQTLKYWNNVANDVDSILSSGENKSCLDILSLSYSYLPVHLKPCFLYMGSFEEDKRVKAEILIKLWLGEGFLKPSKTHNLEKVAEGYLNDLVDRNLILACKRKLNGKIVSCEIHDIVRELCLKIARKEKFLCVLGTPQVGHWEHRVASHESKSKKLYYPRDSLRSTPFICSKRVLNKVDGDFLEFGCSQYTTRYLGCLISKDRTSLYISPSISLLWSLQTLIVKNLFHKVIAPYEFWEMLQLRHVEIEGVRLPHPLPSDCDMSDQANLQTLFTVWNFKLSERVCKRISHIKELRISYSDEESSHCCLHNLCRLHKLESLEVSFSNRLKSAACLSRSLTFPNSLKELTLTSSRLYWNELSNMAGFLPYLEALKLRSNAVIGSQCDTIEGHFDHLKSLTIFGCGDLVSFNADSSHFPALRELVLWNLKKMEELSSSIGDLPSLRRIYLRDCSVSLGLSAMRVLVEQEQEYGNVGIQLEVSFKPNNHMSFRKQMQEEGLNSNNLLLHNQYFFLSLE